MLQMYLNKICPSNTWRHFTVWIIQKQLLRIIMGGRPCRIITHSFEATFPLICKCNLRILPHIFPYLNKLYNLSLSTVSNCLVNSFVSSHMTIKFTKCWLNSLPIHTCMHYLVGLIPCLYIHACITFSCSNHLKAYRC